MCERVSRILATIHNGLEFGKGGEVPVGDGLVDQGPQTLGRLQLRAAGRQEHQADPLGDGQALRSVPAGVVQHEDDVAFPAGAGLPREAGEQRLEEGLGKAAAEIPADIPQMAGGFAGSERMVAIARTSRQRSCRSERCRRPCSRAMMGSMARLPLQNPSFGRASPADVQAGRLRR